jgi:Icc-related predicted phosphoesterase
MRLICISDTHSLHERMTHKVEKYIDPDQDNILIHAGDCTNMGREPEIIEFVYWYQNLKGFDTKIFIAGNHDFGFEHYNGLRHSNEAPWLHHIINEENLSQSDVVYLHDSEFVIEHPKFSRPIKFYGSPWQPEFYNWAFNLPRNGWELELKWKEIPDDTDILITHGPPHGCRDFTPQNLQVGCELLRYRLDTLKPLVHVFGHIHHAYGGAYIDDVLYINASTCTERYVPRNRPIVVDLKEEDGKIVTTYID